VYSAKNNVWTPLKAASINIHFDFLSLLLNHGVFMDITGIDGRIPLRTAASNSHLEVP
jgi:ankyrin repeat protein